MPPHAGPDGAEERIPAVPEITLVPPIPTMSRHASFSPVQVKAAIRSACGGMVVAQSRLVGAFSLSYHARFVAPLREIYDMLIQWDNS